MKILNQLTLDLAISGIEQFTFEPHQFEAIITELGGDVYALKLGSYPAHFDILYIMLLLINKFQQENIQ